MQTNTKVICGSCGKKFKKETLIRNNGTCGRCVNKKIIVKEKCVKCLKECNKEKLKEGICCVCIRHDIMSKRENCPKCQKTFAHFTLLSHDGFCAACKYIIKQEEIDNACIGILNTNVNKINLNAETNSNSVDELKPMKFARISENTCAICLMEFEGETDIIMLKCKHYFHSECTYKTLNLKKECPVCRQPV